jgi:hypothetical protein
MLRRQEPAGSARCWALGHITEFVSPVPALSPPTVWRRDLGAAPIHLLTLSIPYAMNSFVPSPPIPSGSPAAEKAVRRTPAPHHASAPSSSSTCARCRRGRGGEGGCLAPFNTARSITRMLPERPSRIRERGSPSSESVQKDSKFSPPFLEEGITCTASTPARTASAAPALRRRRTRVSGQAASECGSTSLSTSEPATFGASKYRGGGRKSTSMQQGP